MSSSYTPNAANNPATITLPADLDAASAESVNVAFRAVADRGAHLQTLAALLAQANVFTANGQEISNNDAFNAAITISKDAGNDANSGNKWKHILEFKIASEDGRFRLYTGKQGGDRAAALVINAKWDTANQRWFPDDTGYDSIGLLFEHGTGLRLARRAPGAGTWTDWAALTSGSFVAHGDLACDGNAITAGNAVATGNFLYNAARSQITVIPLQLATASGAAEIRAAGGAWELPANTRIEFPIVLPTGATIDSAFFGVEAAGASADWQGDIYKLAPNFTTGALPTPSSIASGGTTGTVTSGSEPDLVAMTGNSEVVNNGTTTYYVSIGCAIGSASSLLAGSPRIFWTDPGPRNH